MTRNRPAAMLIVVSSVVGFAHMPLSTVWRLGSFDVIALLEIEPYDIRVALVLDEPALPDLARTELIVGTETGFFRLAVTGVGLDLSSGRPSGVGLPFSDSRKIAELCSDIDEGPTE